MRRISSLCLPVADQVASSLLRSSLRSRVHRARLPTGRRSATLERTCPEPPPVGEPSSPALRSEHSLQRCWLAFEPQPRHKEAFAQRGRPDSAPFLIALTQFPAVRTDPETPTKPPNARRPRSPRIRRPTKRTPHIGKCTEVRRCPEPPPLLSVRLPPQARFAGPGTPAFRPESRR